MADKVFDEYLAKTELDNLETDGLGVQTKKVSLYGFDTDSLTKKRITVKETDGEVGLNVSGSELQSIAGNSWVSSNIDMADSTYYYFLSFIPGTTKWRINRLNKTSYVSDYAIGNSAIATAWINRASQTYATIY